MKRPPTAAGFPKRTCPRVAAAARHLGRWDTAFSLVEVTLALGIISFAMLAMLGLVVTGLSASREAREDTALAMATQTMGGFLRNAGFTAAATQYAGEGRDFFFDSSGGLQTDDSGVPLTAANTDSFFGCTVRNRAPLGAPSPQNFLAYQLRFYWPMEAPAASRTERVVLMSLARHD